MLDVFGREIGKMRERIFPKLPRRFFYFFIFFFRGQNEGSRGIYIGKIPLWLSAVAGHPTDISNFGLFSIHFRCVFEGLPRLRLS